MYIIIIRSLGCCCNLNAGCFLVLLLFVFPLGLSFLVLNRDLLFRCCRLNSDCVSPLSEESRCRLLFDLVVLIIDRSIIVIFAKVAGTAPCRAYHRHIHSTSGRLSIQFQEKVLVQCHLITRGRSINFGRSLSCCFLFGDGFNWCTETSMQNVIANSGLTQKCEV